ncbi:ribonuclease H-like domain-containing protein [Cladorrhinum samala]|uniref:Ribonuclease n=1 Tax=Cladorrhinum samala TaxID=585594 RepID=A0AAV9HFF2_9PEZI|nr:ribonuclease H-like domain-containing protein [Cladorrhinum samala]
MDDTPTTPTTTLTSQPFLPPSISLPSLLSGQSYTYYSTPPPSSLLPDVPISLGVDEAGRGPVLGPMVYGIFYLPSSLSTPLLKETHRFDDSKILTPAFRLSLLKTLCDSTSELSRSSGWAISSLSARDISANMNSGYNLNAQAMDATVALIKHVYGMGVNVKEIYVDTIGQPATYQAKLEKIFPTAKITVAKKADSLYPVVSAASVCAKVTRDIALETLWKHRSGRQDGAEGAMGKEDEQEAEEEEVMEWGSGYPSDSKCVNWLKGNMHPLFGWGLAETRFSWGTAKDLLEGKNGMKVDWPADNEEEGTHQITSFFSASRGADEGEVDELGQWFGSPVGMEAF